MASRRTRKPKADNNDVNNYNELDIFTSAKNNVVSTYHRINVKANEIIKENQNCEENNDSEYNRNYNRNNRNSKNSNNTNNTNSRNSNRDGKSNDHEIKKSRVRGNECFKCGEVGHKSYECTQTNDIEVVSVSLSHGNRSIRSSGCFNCGQSGHRAAECTDEKVEKSGRQARSNDLLSNKGKGCFNCGQSGHRAVECPQDNTCFLCNEVGHKSFECPTFTVGKTKSSKNGGELNLSSRNLRGGDSAAVHVPAQNGARKRRGRRGGKGRSSRVAVKSTKVDNPIADYSSEWNIAITKSVSESVDNHEYLELLAATLIGQKQKRYPCIPPPDIIENSKTFVGTSIAQEDANNAVINRFSLFNLLNEDDDGGDDNEDDSYDSNNSEDDSDSESNEDYNPDIVVSGKSTQVRYLLLQLLSTIAELHSKKSDQLLKSQNWIDCAYELEQAYLLLNKHRDEPIKAGNWRDAITDSKERDTVSDKHDIGMLTFVVEIFEMVQDFTSKQRDFALNKLMFKLQKVREKLDPMLEERDFVKERYGSAWTNNPNPKMDYVERRAQWVESEKKLMQAIGIIEPLQFI